MKSADYIKGNEVVGGKPNLKPYLDTRGKLTIGFGRCLDTTGITADEADLLFENDLAEAARGATAALTSSAWNVLGAARRCILTDLCFQMGEYGLEGFQKMLAAVRASDWDAAAAELLNSDYARQTPERARRNAEVLRTGVLPEGAT